MRGAGTGCGFQPREPARSDDGVGAAASRRPDQRSTRAKARRGKSEQASLHAYQRLYAARLAEAMALEAFCADGIRRAVAGAVGRDAAPLAEALARRLLAEMRGRPRPEARAVAEIIAALPAFRRLAQADFQRAAPPPRAPLEPPVFSPLPPFARLGLPAWTAPGDLAEAFDEPPLALDWLADADGRAARAETPAARHYYCRWVAKPGGGRRLIEAPKRRLRRIQRRILEEILHKTPVHPAATAFAPGRRVQDGAARHAGEAMVLTLDLRRFFPSIAARRVHGLFRRLGYPPAVARLLTGLTTTRVYVADEDPQPSPAERPLLRTPHLPQGAPTSPALANLCAYALDRRLSGLARRLGAAYTRYADDLAFSGDAPLGAPWVRTAIAEFVEEEGFRLAPEKTRAQPAGGRQRVTGIVVNAHVNPPRREFDRLKAILTNCARQGPASQNRAGHADFRAHLCGRVGWVEQLNPRRGAKLRAIFERIVW